MTSIKSALDAFLASDDFFQAGVIGSTKGARSGDPYSVELFPDGTWRVAWRFGNKYESPGEILQLPSLEIDPSELEEWLSADGNSEDDYLAMAFANERAELEKQLRSLLRS